jgi:diguanylate cyclase (GGDEF)-like protein
MLAWKAKDGSMSATTRSLLRRPRNIEASWPTGLAMLAAVLYLVGYVGNPSLSPIINLTALAVLIGACAWLGLRAWRSRGAQKSRGFQLERSVLYVTTAFVLVRTLFGYEIGGHAIDAYALIYLLLAFLVTFQDRLAAIGAVVTALLLEWGSHLLGTTAGLAELSTGVHLQDELVWPSLVSRTAFIGLFGFLSYLVHGTEVLERRRRHRREVEEERENMLRQAREFRLLNSGRHNSGGYNSGGYNSGGRGSERSSSDRGEVSGSGSIHAEEMAVFDAVEAVQHSTYVSLSLLKTALRCHTCVLLWFDVRSENLHIKELVSDCDAIIEGEIKPAKGVIGGITRRREPVNLEDLRSGFRGIPYYLETQEIRHFLGIPVIENGHLRGVLCADRTAGEAFSATDVNVAEEAAAYILRAIENERMFTSIERTKFELGRFFEASRRLNGVLTPADVYKVALESIAGIAEYDFAAITMYDEDEGLHRIAALDHVGDFGADVDAWQGEAFGENSGLVAMVVKNCHYLPYGGQVRESDPVIFTRAQRLTGIQSMLVLPLIAHDEPIGTIVICHREANRFGAERREMLEVVCNQVAISLQNARLYAQMEEMATTDGLTGLANHRSFQTRLDEILARHRRSQEPFGLILTDIDHFKSVNDTHGHPVGDEVLRQVSRVFTECLREVDLPCRYGGEEFAIILEDTDRETAMAVANRVREAIAALEFTSDQGTFQCTISMGVTIWPEDAEEKHELIDLTDEALYYSKEHGRDQVTSADRL